MTSIYLDHNATTRPLPEVIEVMSQHFHDSYANPGSRHGEGRRARKALEEARESIAEILGADPEEIIFTSGGTESSNMAIFGLTDTPPGTIALTAGEHPATVESCRQLQKRGWQLTNIDVEADGRLSVSSVNDLPWDNLKLVTLILAHNETGVIQDISSIAGQCRERSIPFHLDAVQAVGKIDVNFHALGVTSLALGAHKFHGPRGIGALLLHKDARLAPVQFGGHQEAGRRPGTESVPLIVGMAKALECWRDRAAKLSAQLESLRDRLQAGLQEACPPVCINGSLQHRLPNTLNISFPGTDGDAILVALDLEGIACSLGSTCASGSAAPAPALVAMGCPSDVYSSAVRFSLGFENTPDQIDEAVRRIATVIRRLRSGGQG
jgi:cysteine desulfurase